MKIITFTQQDVTLLLSALEDAKAIEIAAPAPNALTVGKIEILRQKILHSPETLEKPIDSP